MATRANKDTRAPQNSSGKQQQNAGAKGSPDGTSPTRLVYE